MSIAYQPQDSGVLGATLQVQELAIPFMITHNATPASVLITSNQPSLLFINTQGNTQCTVANGAFDTSAEAAAVTFATPVDSTGLINVVVRINEQLAQVVSCSCSSLNNSGSGLGYFPTAPTTGITTVGNKIALNVATGGDFATTDYTGCLVVRYIVNDYTP